MPVAADHQGDAVGALRGSDRSRRLVDRQEHALRQRPRGGERQRVGPFRRHLGEVQRAVEDRHPGGEHDGGGADVSGIRLHRARVSGVHPGHAHALYQRASKRPQFGREGHEQIERVELRLIVEGGGAEGLERQRDVSGPAHRQVESLGGLELAVGGIRPVAGSRVAVGRGVIDGNRGVRAVVEQPTADPARFPSTYAATRDAGWWREIFDSCVPWSRLILPVVLPVVTAPRERASTTVTRRPRRARSTAVTMPVIPAPATTVS